jgi:uncharacterized RmlC-like cupin family protein
MSSSKPTCVVLRPGHEYEGRQGLSYKTGIAAETVGSQGICMHLLEIPPGARGNTHMHESHETAIYVLSGYSEMWYGDDLEEYTTIEPGDLVYIPAGVPHLPGNRSETEPCLAVIARTDPNEQESVVLLPHLEPR